jgi:signal transduction histidine kinase
MFRSITWRLPVSYAAVALLATVALGIVLITTVREFYAREELAYLMGNARAMGEVVSSLLAARTPPEALQAELNNLSFLSQAQLRVLDPAERVLASSSVTGTVDILVTNARFGFAGQRGTRSFLFINAESVPATQLPVPFSSDFPSLPEEPLELPPEFDELELAGTSAIRTIVVAGTPFGFSLDGPQQRLQARSDQVVRETLTAADGSVLGVLELSQGPAYGTEIVESVARGWLIAGGIAVILAALAGWLISRRITQPVLQLTTVTQRMAAGDLSHRANVQRRDELGMLAHSFNEMADQVEGTITTLRRFVSDAAHELHSPLTALQTDLELSASETNAARRDELIAQAQQQALRLRELADNLLDLSRVEAAGQVAFVVMNLNELLIDLSEPYASQADQAGLTLSLDLPQDPIELRGDPAQLRRAIGNLVDNAIKFTPEGGAIAIGLQKAANAIELCVQDTGIGIPEDDLPQLFNRFHRGRNVANYPGNGLGLAIVKAIVEAHGGQVSAANISPGARFCITLPEAR